MNNNEHLDVFKSGDVGEFLGSDEKYRIFKAVKGHVEEVIYLFNDKAKKSFKNALKTIPDFDRDPDFCLIKNCVVVDGQERILTTSETEYSLFYLDDKYKPHVMTLRGGRRSSKTNMTEFTTPSGKDPVTNKYMGLLFPDSTIQKTKKQLGRDNPEALEEIADLMMITSDDDVSDASMIITENGDLQRK